MGLIDKYAKLIGFAKEAGVENLDIKEQNDVLHVSGIATASKKDKLWEIYNQIDPDMRAGDLVLDIEVKAGGEEVYEVKAGDNLSKIAKKYPNMTWQKIFEANKDKIKDPNKILVGQEIIIPL